MHSLTLFPQSAIVTCGYFTAHLNWAKRARKLTFNTRNRERKEEPIVVCEVLGLCILARPQNGEKMSHFFRRKAGARQDRPVTMG